ncbi:MAG: hypothetical protein KDA24_16320 [Deltaproteobacteria bacterium]|nr:hypothetical protein [Deltaproteobacteria bacterium]
MLARALLISALGLSLVGCPAGSDEPEIAAPSKPVVSRSTSAAVGAMAGAAPTVAATVDGKAPQLDACGALLDSNNRCGPVKELSAQIPGDVCLPEGVVEPNSASVEHLAWKTFVALNWPVTPQGVPASDGPLVADHAPGGHAVAWETWRSPPELLQLLRANEGMVSKADWSTPADLPEACNAKAGSLLLEQTATVSDAVAALLPEVTAHVNGGPAVDQNGRPVLVETRMNRTMWDVVVSGGWYEPGSSPRGLQFPNNHGDTAYGVGAMAVQAAWVILDAVEEGDASMRVRTAYVYQEGNEHRSAVCDEVLVGLVALQIGHKAAAGDDTWVWSVFEHSAVAPLDDNGPSREYMFQTTGCAELGGDVCADVVPGSATEAARCCPNTDLHGRLGPKDRLSDDRTPTHLTRLDAWTDSSSCTEHYRKALAGTPWSNFALIGAQWWENEEAETLQFGPRPRTLRSLVLEPWATRWVPEGQDTVSSCIGCHQAGDDGVFFLKPLRQAIAADAEAPSQPSEGAQAEPAEEPAPATPAEGSDQESASPSEPTSAPE